MGQRRSIRRKRIKMPTKGKQLLLCKGKLHHIYIMHLFLMNGFQLKLNRLFVKKRKIIFLFSPISPVFAIQCVHKLPCWKNKIYSVRHAGPVPVSPLPTVEYSMNTEEVTATVRPSEILPPLAVEPVLLSRSVKTKLHGKLQSHTKTRKVGRQSKAQEKKITSRRR